MKTQPPPNHEVRRIVNEINERMVRHLNRCLWEVPGAGVIAAVADPILTAEFVYYDTLDAEFIDVR